MSEFGRTREDGNNSETARGAPNEWTGGAETSLSMFPEDVAKFMASV